MSDIDRKLNKTLTDHTNTQPQEAKLIKKIEELEEMLPVLE